MPSQGQVDHVLKEAICFGDPEIKLNFHGLQYKAWPHFRLREGMKLQPQQTRGQTLPFSPWASPLLSLNQTEHEELRPQNKSKMFQKHLNLVFPSESFMVNPPTQFLIGSSCSIPKRIVFCSKYLLGHEGHICQEGWCSKQSFKLQINHRQYFTHEYIYRQYF